MNKVNLLKLSSVLFVVLLFTSCSSVGLLSDENSWLPHKIDDFSDFYKAYLILQISILINSLLWGIFFGRGGYPISVITHFIWIVSYRDYGFLIVLLLFGLFSIIRLIISPLYLIYSK
jgi:hypothetical protein